MYDKSNKTTSLDTDGFASKRSHKPFRRLARPHEKYVVESPQIGQQPETVDSAELLCDTGTPQEKEKGFFARIFRK